MTSEELFHDGQLGAAVEAQIQRVKQQPGQIAERVFLFELLCLQDEFDRAEKQLDAIAQLDVQRDAAVQPYRNLIQAERQRRQLVRDGLPPVVSGEAPPRLMNHLQAVNRLREQSPAEAQALLDEAENDRPELKADIDGKSYDDFRDCDDLFSSVFEVFVGPQYLWVPMEQVRTVQFARPERPRDLVWAQVNMLMHDGSLLRGFFPVRYVDSGTAERDDLKLGRSTDWSDASSGPVRGVGQRMFLAGDDAHALLDVKMIALSPRAAD